MHSAALVLPWMGSRTAKEGLCRPRIGRLGTDLGDGRLSSLDAGFYPGRSAFHYSPHGLLFVLACSACTRLALCTLIHHENGGKASIVVPVSFWSGPYT